MGKKKPDCFKCSPDGFVIVIPENYEVLGILDNYINLMIDGNSSINAQGIHKVLEWERLENDILLRQKILMFITASLSKRNEVLQHG